MKTDALLALRAQVQADQELSSYLQEHFGRGGSHRIGFRRARKTEDYPYFSYVLAQETRDNPYRERLQKVSILWGINQKEIDSQTDTCTGLLEVCEIGDLLVNAILKDCSLGAQNIRVEPSFDTATDLGVRHPIYEAEMVLTIRVREE